MYYKKSGSFSNIYILLISIICSFYFTGCQLPKENQILFHSSETVKPLNFIPVDYDSIQDYPFFALVASELHGKFEFYRYSYFNYDLEISILYHMKIGNGDQKTFCTSADFTLIGLYLVTQDGQPKELYNLAPIHGIFTINPRTGKIEINTAYVDNISNGISPNSGIASFKSMQLIQPYFFGSPSVTNFASEILNIFQGYSLITIDFICTYSYLLPDGYKFSAQDKFNQFSINIPVVKLTP